MDSFPSSWIINPKDSETAQDAPFLPPPRIPSPRFHGPPPVRRREHRHFCECDGVGHHDDVYPEILKEWPFSQKDWPASPVFVRRGSYSSHPRSRSPLRDGTDPSRGQLGRSRSGGVTPRAGDSPPPEPHPEPHAHYATHFPSSWLISNERPNTTRRLSSASSGDGDISRSFLPARPKTKSVPTWDSSGFVKSTKERSPRASNVSKARSSMSTPKRVESIPPPTVPNGMQKMDAEDDNTPANDDKSRDLMADLKGEPAQLDKEERIGMWVERVSTRGSFPSSTGTIVTPSDTFSSEEAKPKAVGFEGDMDIDRSDASGLGDAPHVNQGMNENYSMYSESTNKAEQAVKG